MMNKRLASLLERNQLIRRGGEVVADAKNRALATGYAALDERLPGAGWPLGCVIDIFYQKQGIGEFSLLLPALAKVTAQGDWVCLTAPPHIPYPLTLAAAGIDLTQLLVIRLATTDKPLAWAVEQALLSGGCRAVVAWSKAIEVNRLRRLQLAAERYQSLCVLFRPWAEASSHSPAGLRLRIQRDNAHGLQIEIFKSQRGLNGQTNARAQTTTLPI